MVRQSVVFNDAAIRAIAVSPEMRKYLLRVAKAGARGAQRRAPVRTGTLRRSIKAEVGNDGTAWWGSDLDYARYVEFGTRRMAAQPFLRPSVDDAVREARRR